MFLVGKIKFAFLLQTKSYVFGGKHDFIFLAEKPNFEFLAKN